jgi:hypothetical protein
MKKEPDRTPVKNPPLTRDIPALPFRKLFSLVFSFAKTFGIL